MGEGDGFSISGKADLSSGQMNALIANKIGGSFFAGLKEILNYNLMNKMFGLQTDQMKAHYANQTELVGLNKQLITSQEKIADRQLAATEKIAEYQKERDVAVARTRADAAVKIAKVNALNSQYYGQPNQLPSLAT